MENPTIQELLEAMVREQASDMYLTVGALPSLRVSDHIIRAGTRPLEDEDIETYLSALITEEQYQEFDTTLEFNSSIEWSESARFRLNIFRQQHHIGAVIRRIATAIPTLEELELPPIYADLIMLRRGLVLVAGATGCGKSTSLAAMIGHRNRHGFGHVVTIEDPIEFIHKHDRCIITQRDVGIDTYSFGMALKNALRQRPDVIVIGEIRDRETMEHAISFAETGHLCIATVHASNAQQTLERIIGLFPQDKHAQLLANLSLNLRAVLAQRLVPLKDDESKRTIALEIMLNVGRITQLIEEGKIKDIREMVERGETDGMRSMDQSLLALLKAARITTETAIAESDNPPNMRLALRQQSSATTPRNIETLMRIAPGGVSALHPQSDGF